EFRRVLFRSPLQPLVGLGAPSIITTAVSENFLDRFHTMDTMDEFEQALKRARSEGKWVLVDYYADWCISCHVIEREVFGNAEVQQALADFVLLRPDVTRSEERRV